VGPVELEEEAMSHINRHRTAVFAVLATVVVVAASCVMPPPPPVTTSTTTSTTTTTTTTTTTIPCPTFPLPSLPSTVPPGDAVLAENPVTGVTAGCEKPVVFTWSGQTPGKLMYVDICRKVTSDPSFNPGQDCAPLSSLNPNATATGSGSTVVQIFRGREPSGDLDWGCFAATDVAPAGVEKNTTCYVRVTNNSLFNNAEAREAAFTLS
jgi:hypothetical protein